MPRATDTDQTGAIGVTLVQAAVEQQLGWIFRREEHRDTGLDAHVEVVLHDEATGLLLGLQIKTGASYFGEQTDDGWRYRGDYAHLRYWTEHNLPVVLVLVDPESKVAYWALVDSSVEITEGQKSWTIEVRRKNRLDKDSRTAWMDLAFAVNPRDALYRYCVIQIHYIDVLVNGGRLFVEVDDWVNKTRGKADFCLVLEDEKGNVSKERFFMFAGVHEASEFIEQVFPWADALIDEEFYEIHEDIEPAAVFQDSESPGGYFIIEGERATGTTRPYSWGGGGEVEHYRFELTLNEAGQAFANFSAHALQLPAYPPYYLAKMITRNRK